MLTLLSEDFSTFSLRARAKAAAEEKKKCILIVPEQETLSAEAEMAARLSEDAPLFFEVTNFSRLANTVFRIKGGVALRYADKASSALVMWKVLDAAAPLLSLTNKTPDAAYVKEMLAALGELYAAGVGADMLEEAAKKIPAEDRLHSRISDLSLIFRLYTGELAHTYGNHAEDLDRLYAVLKEDPLLKDTLVFVDSFTSFTAQEYRVLGELMRMTDVTVALTTAKDDPDSLCYEETRDTEKRLLSLARASGTKIQEEKTAEASLPPALRYAARGLFRAGKSASFFEGSKDSISLWRAENPFSAAMSIASDISRRVRQGARYGDFTIFVRNTQNYRGILDAAFEKQGIPFFMSEEKDIFSFAAIKMITTAYAVINRGYQKQDIIAFLKCSFGPFSSDDADIFETYADFWHVGGKLFLQQKDFSMNPSGYKKEMTEEEKEILFVVNRVHRELLRLFAILQNGAEKDSTVTEHLTALYAFLVETNCEERLCAMAAEAEGRGDTAHAEMLSRLFGALCEMMDRAHETVGDMIVSRERFADILSLLFSSVSLGQLPTAQDAVTVGNAEMLRAQGARFVYLLGANDGEFPANVRVGGAFEMNEREALSKLGLPLAFDPLIQSSRENFCFLRALTAASEHTTVISCDKNASGEATAPAAVFTKLTAMFGAPTAQADAEPYHPRAALYMLGEITDANKKKALKELLQEDAEYRRILSDAEIPLSETNCEVSAALTEQIFPKEMRMSQSRLDSYVDCPFSYYCKNVLSLGEDRDSAFGFSDIGSLIHAILERLFLKLSKEGKTIQSAENSELSAAVESLCREYLSEICPEELADSPRLAHVFKRLRSTASLLAEELRDEFAQSRFSPTFFEFPIGEKGAHTPIAFETEDGGKMIFHGYIDRVDTYRAEDGRLYFRVIDYKTGTKIFSLSDVEKGKNLQLLIYLISLWKSQDKSFLQKLCLSCDDAPIPAGMLYMSASPKDIKYPAPAEEEEIRDKAKESLKVNGLVLEDEEIIRAMDATLSGRYAPTPLDRYGKMKYGKSFVSLEDLENIFDGMKGKVGEIGSKMRKGIAHAEPLIDGSSQKSPCEHCAFFPVCRRI